MIRKASNITYAVCIKQCTNFQLQLCYFLKAVKINLDYPTPCRDIKLFVVQHLQIHRLPFVGKYMYWKCVYWTAHLQSRQLTPWVLSTLAISTVCHSEATKAQKLHMLQLWIEKKDLNFHIFTLTVSSQQKWLLEAIYEFTETLFTLCTFNTHDLMDNKSVLQSPPSGMASLSADSFLFFWPCYICDRFCHTQLYC